MDAMQEQAASKTRTDNGAVASLVLGLVSLPGLFAPPLFFAGLVAVLFGWSARRRIAQSGGALKGKWFAVAGVMIGVLGCLLSLVFPAFVLYVWIYAAFHGGQLPGNGLM
jgi:hypothetical protein